MSNGFGQQELFLRYKPKAGASRCQRRLQQGGGLPAKIAHIVGAQSGNLSGAASRIQTAGGFKKMHAWRMSLVFLFCLGCGYNNPPKSVIHVTIVFTKGYDITFLNERYRSASADMIELDVVPGDYQIQGRVGSQSFSEKLTVRDSALGGEQYIEIGRAHV